MLSPRSLILLTLILGLSAVYGQDHPADINTDGLLSIDEVTAYAKAAEEATNWPSGPSPVLREDAQRAEFIWKNGERYGLVPGVATRDGWIPAPPNGPTFLTVEDLNPEPMDGLVLHGLPPDQDGLILEYRLEGDSEIRYGPLHQLDTNVWALYVPYVQGTPGGAKPMDLWVVSETERFPVVSLDPDPLPSYAGTAAAINTSLTNLATLAGTFLGENPIAYHDAAPDAIPEEMRALVMVDRVFRDADNPNNLSKVLTGTAPLLQNSGVSTEDLDAMMGKLGLLDRLQALETSLATNSINSLPLSRTSTFGSGGLDFESQSSISPRNLIDIQTLGQLASAMQKQCDADRYANPSQEVQNVKDAASLASIVVSLAGPPGAAAAATFGAVSWAIDTYHLVIANQWPSNVDNFQLRFTPTFSIEDDCSESSWSATMNATSRDWSLDKTVVTGALNLLGGYKAGADFLQEGAEVGIRAGFKASLNDAEGTMAGIIEAESQIALDKTFPNTNAIPISASLWSGIIVTESDFGLIEVLYEGTSVAQGSTMRKVVPKEVGQTIVRVRTLPGSLGPCAVVEGGAANYEVKPNKVTITPSGGDVKPNQVINFTATVTDAKDLSLTFEKSHGTFSNPNYNPVTGIHEITWTAPTKEQMPDGEITITAKSLASECLRNGVERNAVATFSPYETEYLLSPSVGCLNPGDIKVFEVLDLKFGEVPPVEWEVFGTGSIDPNGSTATYTADQNGSDIIVATVKTPDGDVILEQEIKIGCSLTSGFYFDPTLLPSVNSTSKSQLAGFIIEQHGAIYSDVFVEYTSLEAPAEGSPIGWATGTFTGAGIFTPLDPDEIQALIDDSQADRTYTVSTQSGPTEYSVTADFGEVEITQEENFVDLPGGKNGQNIEMKFDAGSSSTGSVGNIDNEIVQYNWTFSDGFQATGETINYLFPRDLERLTVTLRVVDKLGNWAEYKQTYLVVQLSGTFAFPYEPSGIVVSAFPWEFPGDPPPPELTPDGYFVFITDPATCFLSLTTAGGEVINVNANSSTVGVSGDETTTLFVIGYVSTGGFGF
jgi:hypothetical protein